MLHQRYQKINEDAHEMQERAKNYVIEDFLESNRITMKDLSDLKTKKMIQENLVLLEQCNYDYDIYKKEKRSLKVDTKIEKENFLNDIKKLKNQIHKVDKTQMNKTDESAQKVIDDVEDEPFKQKNK
jgi:C-mannosyltransferase DPY19L